MKLILVFLGALALASAQECTPNEFQCGDGRCIPWDWRCDGENDCGNWEDETDCTGCDFECNRRCIPDWKICDGRADCENGEDEEGCPSTTTTTCPGFICPNQHCIPTGWVCDGEDDCNDGSDEIWQPGMPGFACPGTGRCLTEERKCDEKDDCRDGFDESIEMCPCADDNDFRCGKPPGSNVPGPCIPPDWVCDEEGIWDCPDGSDEANCIGAMKRARTHPKVKRAPQKKVVARSSVRRNDLLWPLMQLGKTGNNKVKERR